ncbi:MAG: hypothetical protein C5B49_03685 [Bdellovibrio sp.]|nr:MAG: hypothetical protein C5B49_03685 [Bdellovibrio sp.]
MKVIIFLLFASMVSVSHASLGQPIDYAVHRACTNGKPVNDNGIDQAMGMRIDGINARISMGSRDISSADVCLQVIDGFFQNLQFDVQRATVYCSDRNQQEITFPRPSILPFEQAGDALILRLGGFTEPGGSCDVGQELIITFSPTIPINHRNDSGQHSSRRDIFLLGKKAP